MDTQVCYSLVKLLTNELPRGNVYSILEQSLLACESRKWERMSELAHSAKVWAREQHDRIGEATALIHQAIASAQMKRYDIALDVCNRAIRMFRRDPAWHQRLGEGLATYALGLIYDSNLEAIKHYRGALDLLDRLQEFYAEEGNKSKQEAITKIVDVLRLKIGDQLPAIHIDGLTYFVTPPMGQDETRLQLKSNVDYRVISIDEHKYKDEYKESGLSSGDSILVRRIGKINDIESGSLGVRYMSSGDFELGKFERDEAGNIQFIRPGAEVTIIGVADVHSTGRIDAILKRTWPLI